jgi:hypothetical protein
MKRGTRRLEQRPTPNHGAHDALGESPLVKICKTFALGLTSNAPRLMLVA